MDKHSALDDELDTDRGHFRVITKDEQGAAVTSIYRRLPDGPHTEVYRAPAPQGDAQATHDRIVAAVKACTLP